MAFAGGKLRVALATWHVPLKTVSRELTPARLERAVRRAGWLCRAEGIKVPRIAVCGINPHAGEHGLLGTEDEDVVRPAVTKAAAMGMAVSGPFPADTLFVRARKGEFDVVIACYHDQGLIPVKLVAFGRAVNVTLGLPIIRTSVDHGTAFDIAGKGVADAGSMIEAVLLAARLARSS
jgi:4-hydroxythreonine-4-phosphate dehydrogenase